MKIAVFCSSSETMASCYYEAARKFGKLIGENGHELIFGGYAHGLMGTVARAASESGAKVLGITTKQIGDVENSKYCTQIIRMESIARRKELMETTADVIIMLPGGIGTFAEFFESCELSNLEAIKAKVLVYNTYGFFNQLQAFLAWCVKMETISGTKYRNIQFFTHAESIFKYIDNMKK